MKTTLHDSKPLCCLGRLHQILKAASAKSKTDLKKTCFVLGFFNAQILVFLQLELAAKPLFSFKDWTTSAWGLIFYDFSLTSL